ncbi:heterochromatin protein 1-binding protein 3 isoform X2 [Osmerus eperlanus]|uniref:heterochromatin protein 1-binding protein 3 isoform X2 n=1 Tax=Osmerus eperlanus TaxID=29151 RepID=UPI002E13681C
MPIRRAAGSNQETAPSAAPEAEPDASSEESASVGEGVAAAPAPGAKQGEEAAEGEEAEGGEAPKENGEKAEEAEKNADESAGEKAEEKKAEGEEAEKKEEKDGVKEKPKKPMKRTVPAWATLSASKKVVVTTKFAGNQPKVDDILFEAVESCKDKTGASVYSVMKYIVNKYPNLELDKRKYLLKKALQRQVEKGTIRQLKGKGFSGSFTIGKQPPKPAAKPTVTPGMKAESLGDALPLIITRLCEPKEASYILIKKYVEQHFPHFNVENRPDILKSALVRAVEKGHLEQITGKGASGTFQLKRAGDKILMKGGPLEDAIFTAITAMNEPKTCSIPTLRKHLVETNKDNVEYRLVNTLKKTLQKCKMMGWMEQITGNGLTGTYQLSYPYYPSPAVLFPDKHKPVEKPKRRRTVDSSSEESSSEEEEESEEESSEDDEPPPPPKRKAQKRPAPKARRPPPSKKPRPASQSKAKGKRPAPGKKAPPPAKKLAPPARKSAPPPARKPVPPAKKPAASSKAAPPKKAPPPPAKSTPVKKAAPARKPKTPVAKKLTSRATKRPVAKKLPPAKPAAKPAAKSAVKTKPAARKSVRGRK